jgi:hypothetical protein
MFKVVLSLIFVAVIAISMSRRVRLAARYERAPRKLTTWNSMDKGIDPTEDQS